MLPGYEDPNKHYDYTYIALGAGVQSTALLLMSNLGLYDVPKADVAIFADTLAEPESVYETLEALIKVSDIPVVKVCEGDLEKTYVAATKDKKVRGAALPAYTMSEDGSRGILMRQCTADYKVKPIEQYVRRVGLGLKPRQRCKSMVRAMMGISWDESQRVKPSRNKWCDLSYPLIDNQIRREKCLRIVEEFGEGWPTPSKSACYFCPFHGDSVWLDMQRNHPEDFERACQFDESIRTNVRLRNKVYLHNSCKPLREIDFTRGGQMEFDFTGCDSGHCGI